MALVLKRRLGQAIRIGRDGEVRVELTKNKHGALVLAVDAPRDVPVHREEVWRAITDEGEAA